MCAYAIQGPVCYAQQQSLSVIVREDFGEAPKCGGDVQMSFSWVYFSNIPHCQLDENYSNPNISLVVKKSSHIDGCTETFTFSKNGDELLTKMNVFDAFYSYFYHLPHHVTAI